MLTDIKNIFKFYAFVFSLGLALMLSAVEVYFRDIEHIISVVMIDDSCLFGTSIL